MMVYFKKSQFSYKNTQKLLYSFPRLGRDTETARVKHCKLWLYSPPLPLPKNTFVRLRGLDKML